MTDYFKAPIFVLGLPRSGTSMLAGVLRICGAWTGRTIPGGRENPKGFFEHIALRENIVKPVLVKLGCDPLGVKVLPPADLRLEIAGIDKVIRTVIENGGYQHDRPWLYKDAKLTLLWPVFARAFPAARWVIVRRDEDSIINSCLNTGFMRQHSAERDYWAGFIRRYQSRLAALQRSGATCFEVSTGAVVGGRLHALQQTVEALGLAYRADEVKEFIAPELWHGRSTPAG